MCVHSLCCIHIMHTSLLYRTHPCSCSHCLPPRRLSETQRAHIHSARTCREGNHLSQCRPKQNPKLLPEERKSRQGFSRFSSQISPSLPVKSTKEIHINISTGWFLLSSAFHQMCFAVFSRIMVYRWSCSKSREIHNHVIFRILETHRKSHMLLCMNLVLQIGCKCMRQLGTANARVPVPGTEPLPDEFTKCLLNLQIWLSCYKSYS